MILRSESNKAVADDDNDDDDDDDDDGTVATDVAGAAKYAAVGLDGLASLRSSDVILPSRP